MKRIISALFVACLFILQACTATPSQTSPAVSESMQSTAPEPSSSMTAIPSPSPEVSENPEIDLDTPTEKPIPSQTSQEPDIDTQAYESFDLAAFLEDPYSSLLQPVYTTGMVVSHDVGSGYDLIIITVQEEESGYCMIDLPSTSEKFETGDLIKIYGTIDGINDDLSAFYPEIRGDAVALIDETAPILASYTGEEDIPIIAQALRDQAVAFDYEVYKRDPTFYHEKMIDMLGFVHNVQPIEGTNMWAIIILPQSMESICLVGFKGDIDVEQGDIIRVYGQLMEEEDDPSPDSLKKLSCYGGVIDILEKKEP